MQSLLTPGQKALLRSLLALGGFLAANSLYLHFSPPRGQVLPAFYQAMLLAHIYGGILLLAPMTVFILWHFTVVLRKRHAFAVWSGVGIATAAVLLAVTGLFLREKANTQENRVWYLTHWALGLGIPAAYVLHRVSAEHKPGLRRVLFGVGGVAGTVLLMIGIHRSTAQDPPPATPAFSRIGYGTTATAQDPFLPFDPRTLVAEAGAGSPFFPSPVKTSDGSYVHYAAVTNGDVPDVEGLQAEVRAKGFASDHVIGAETCARCHPDVVEQWKTSAHRFSSFNNPFYRASVMDMRTAEKGIEKRNFLKSKWCAGCHDPAVLFPGRMEKEFDADLPDAQAGLTCLACHAIETLHSVAGNGGYTFRDKTQSEYLFSGVKEGPGAALHDLLVRSKPEVHKRDMKPPLMATSEFCAACHKVSLQEPVNDYRWLRGQNDYDSWHNSGVARNNPQTFYLPPKARSCQECHMPPEPAPLGDVSARDGTVKSHRFPGINTALPAVRGDLASVKRIEAFLQDKKLRVDVFAVERADGTVARAPDLGPVPLREGEEVEVQVVVRNLGVGHIFPAGTLDSNEGWLEVQILDPGGKVLARSGGLLPDLTLSPESHTYGATIIDREGRRIDRRNAKDIFTPAQVNVVPPGAADLARYRLEVPAGLAGRALAVRATLRFRKFKPDYTRFSFAGRVPPVLPVTDIATAEARFPVLPAGAPLPTQARPATAPDWTRWNDQGIAMMRQRDTRGAAEAFAEVDRLAPALPDGPRNLARVRITEGRYADALDVLEGAEARAPGDARTAYWFGVAHARLGHYDPALEAFERVLRDFPQDRNTLGEIAGVFFQTGNVEESLKWWLRVLEVDPEDANAHYHRHLCYTRLGRDADAAEAEKSFLRYKVDESAAQRTNLHLREQEEVNREAQSVHVHHLQSAQ